MNNPKTVECSVLYERAHSCMQYCTWLTAEFLKSNEGTILQIPTFTVLQFESDADLSV